MCKGRGILVEYVRLRDVDIKEHVGKRLYLLFLVKDITIRPQKDGGEYMAFNMVDKDKSVEAKIFGVTQEVKEKVVEGKAYRGIIDVKTYKKNGLEFISCVVYGMDEAELDASHFANWADNLQSYANILSQVLDEISGTIYGEITRSILVRYWDRFTIWPAAKGNHHTELGGLLWHTTTVVQLCKLIGQMYKQTHGENFINMPLLIAGAILHDIMKTREYIVDTSTGVTEYSNEAALTTHIIDIITEIGMEAYSRGLQYTEEVQLLKHVVASHHGKLEWGSPITCNIPEAVILHRVDELDAEMWKFNKTFRELKSGEYQPVWENGELHVRYKEANKI